MANTRKRSSRSSNSNAASGSASEAEPAAKRIAIGNDQEELDDDQDQDEDGQQPKAPDPLIAAQAAFDRLDVKSALQICNQIIDSDHPDPSQFLLLRSRILERRGQTQEASQDVTKALELHQDPKTRIRTAFSLLGKALHQIESVASELEYDLELEELHKPNDPRPDQLFSALKRIHKSINESKELENKTLFTKGPFQRIPSEVFQGIISFFDTPSMVIGGGVCRDWMVDIYKRKDLYQRFIMEGDPKKICQGLRVFSKRCRNQLEIIRIEFKLPRFGDIGHYINLNCSTLKELSISDPSELDSLALGVLRRASECPSLLVLVFKSTFKGPEQGNNSSVAEELNSELSGDEEDPHEILLQLLPIWNPRLRTLIWNGRKKKLEANHDLLNALQEADEIDINSNISQEWIAKLLTLNPNLVKLSLPSIKTRGREETWEFPKLELPNLKHLYLERPLESTSWSTSFFQNLKAPKLSHLSIGIVDTKDLSHLKPEFAPTTFIVYRLTKEIEEIESEKHANDFIKAIEKWDRLKNLTIILSKDSQTAFWKQLCYLLSPLSRENVQAGYRRDQVLLPKLQSLSAGGPTDLSRDDRSGLCDAIACLVATRKAVHNRLSLKDLLLINSGDFKSSDAIGPSEDTPFKNQEICTLIQSLQVRLRLDLGAAREWLKDNVPNFHFEKSGEDIERQILFERVMQNRQKMIGSFLDNYRRFECEPRFE